MVTFCAIAGVAAKAKTNINPSAFFISLLPSKHLNSKNHWVISHANMGSHYSTQLTAKYENLTGGFIQVVLSETFDRF